LLARKYCALWETHYLVPESKVVSECICDWRALAVRENLDSAEAETHMRSIMAYPAASSSTHNTSLVSRANSTVNGASSYVTNNGVIEALTSSVIAARMKLAEAFIQPTSSYIPFGGVALLCGHMRCRGGNFGPELVLYAVLTEWRGRGRLLLFDPKTYLLKSVVYFEGNIQVFHAVVTYTTLKSQMCK
jgi:hypothetical protein